MRHWLLFLLGMLLLGWGSVAQAAEVTAVRLEITGVEQPAASWWQRWLGARPQIVRPSVGTKFRVQSSAYSPSPWQTDSTPCITAAGTRVRRGVVAANFLPLGTLLSINGELFIVEDRMHPRYGGSFIDIWFPSTKVAREFGRQSLTIEIVGYGTPGQELTASTPSWWRRGQLRFVAMSERVRRWTVAAVAGRPADVDCSQ